MFLFFRTKSSALAKSFKTISGLQEMRPSVVLQSHHSFGTLTRIPLVGQQRVNDSAFLLDEEGQPLFMVASKMTEGHDQFYPGGIEQSADKLEITSWWNFQIALLRLNTKNGSIVCIQRCMLNAHKSWLFSLMRVRSKGRKYNAWVSMASSAIIVAVATSQLELLSRFDHVNRFGCSWR